MYTSSRCGGLTILGFIFCALLSTSYIEFVDNSQNIYSLIIDHMLNETFNAFLDDTREQNPVCLNNIHSGMCKMLISKDFQI